MGLGILNYSNQPDVPKTRRNRGPLLPALSIAASAAAYLALPDLFAARESIGLFAMLAIVFFLSGIGWCLAVIGSICSRNKKLSLTAVLFSLVPLVCAFYALLVPSLVGRI